MLGKLIKNDLKSALRSVANIYFAMLIAVAVMGISLVTDFMMGKAISSAFLLIIAFVGILVTVFVVFMDFRKTMFGDRGYLTNTLPVTSPALIFSKTLTSMIWITISYLVMIGVAIFIIIYNTDFSNLGMGEEINLQFFFDLFAEFGLKSQEVTKVSLILIAIKGIFQLAVFVTIAFFAMTLSNIRPFHRLGLFGTIVFFFVIYGLLAFLGGRIADFFTMDILVHTDASIGFSTNAAVTAQIDAEGGYYVALTHIIFQMLLCIALFVVNSELIEKKVNIK